MTGSRKEGRFTGIYMPERTTGVCFVCGGEKIRRDRPGTESDGLKEPAALIRKEDTAGPVVRGFPDHITRFSGREAGAGTAPGAGYEVHIAQSSLAQWVVAERRDGTIAELRIARNGVAAEWRGAPFRR